MKKLFAIILVLCVILCMAGCITNDIVGENIDVEAFENEVKSATLQEARDAYAEAYANDIQDGLLDGRPVYVTNYAAIGGIPTFVYESNGYVAHFDGAEWTVLKGSFFTITRNDDFTYSYRVVDVNGNLLFENGDYHREPKIAVVAPTVYGLVTQTGTGLSTNWAVYCDVVEGKTSEFFSYVLVAKGEYVIYVDRINSEPVIIVQNIFDKARYYKEYKLEHSSSVAADVVKDCRFDSNGNAIVTYHTGEDYAQAEITIKIP